MANVIARALCISVLLAGISPASAAQQYPQGNSSALPQQSQYPQGDTAAQPQANVQAVSSSGLLPVYGIELRAEKTWIDSQFPSQSRSFQNSGVNASFQAAWDSLKAGGYNILRVPLDVRDSQSANRIANLCTWARSQNVKILVVLAGATEPDYGSKAASLVTTLVSSLRNSQSADAYLQIAAYQLDDEINHPGVHGQLPPAMTQQLLKAAQAVRAAERQALQGTTTEPTPLMASASFDYELIQAKAIAGVPFTDAAYQQAYSSLLRFLQPLAQSPDLDLLSVSWFPGTVSTGSVDKPPLLLRSLASDLPGKQIVFATGFSTAFASPEDQRNYYTLTFANLGDLRATAAGDSPFMGVVFREALNGKAPREPRGAVEQMKKWDWSAKADELAAMWNGKRRSDDMKWWWDKVQNNMGLASLQSASGGTPQFTPLPAQQAMGQIASAVSDTNAAAGPYPPYPGQDASSGYQPGNTYPSGSSGSGTAGASGQPGNGFKDGFQSRMLALLDAAIQRVGGAHGVSASGSVGGNCYPGSTDVSCASTGQYPGSPSAGQYPQGGQYPGQYPDPSQSGQYPNSQTYPQGQYPQTGQYPDPGQQYPGQNPAGGQYPSGSQYPNAGQYPSGDPSGGVAQPGLPGQPSGIGPGSILIAQQDVSIQPAKAQAGQPVSISAKVRNQGQSDAAGLVLFASDASNTVLAEADNVNVPRGSAAPVTLQFVPVDAQTALPLVVHVSDSLGSEIASVALPPISVAPMPGGSNAGAGSSAGSASDPNSSGDNGSSGGMLGSKLYGAIGIARIAMVPLQRFLIAGEPVPVMANMSNPFGIPMRNVHASLLIDGVATQSQTMSFLLPHQSRSLIFPNVIVKKPGTHEVRIVVQSQRGNAKPQVANLVTRMTFFSPKSRPPMMRAGTGGMASHPAATAHVRSITSPGFTASPHPITPSPGPGSTTGTASQQSQGNSSAQRPTLTSRSMAQGGAGTQGPPYLYAKSGTGSPGVSGGTRPIGSGGTPTTTSSGTGSQPAGGTNKPPPVYRPMGAAHPFVSLNSSEISYGPSAPKPGQPVTFSIIVRNGADAPAPRVSLVLKLYADGKLVALTQQPIQFPVGPRSGFRATWQAGMPSGRQVQLVAAVAADGDGNPNGKQTSIAVRTSAPPVQPRIGSPAGVKIH